MNGGLYLLKSVLDNSIHGWFRGAVMCVSRFSDAFHFSSSKVDGADPCHIVAIESRPRV